MNGKTVYILGAGFSVDAGVPPQNQILNKIFSLVPEERMAWSKVSFVDLPEDLLSLTAESFRNARKELAKYIATQFTPELSSELIYKKNTDKAPLSTQEKKQQEHEFEQVFQKLATDYSGISLEDIFTTLDKAILNKENIYHYSTGDLLELRRNLSICIVYSFTFYTLEAKYANHPPNGIYNRVAHYFVNKRIDAGNKGDPFSIITLNWDTVLDCALNEATLEINKDKKGRSSKVFLDYCIYDYSCPGEGDMPVSTQIKARGHMNLKLLKLHGSLNWLSCMNCGRLFKTFIGSVPLQEYYEGKELGCPYCKECFEFDNIPESTPILQKLLLTPTFVKDFNDHNIKNIWKNAFIELSEAKSIVFIGYSFPEADFELRYLLNKAVIKDTEITVVLHESDDPQRFRRAIENDDVFKRVSMGLPETRYKMFFGANRVNFGYSGMGSYFNNLFRCP